ncbi:MAG: peptidase, partial [bacterium]|nr:peptidase [bacterium]
MKKIFAITAPLVLLAACAGGPADMKTEADAFLRSYTDTYQMLSYTAAEAEWASNTRIVEGDTTNTYKARMANEALAAFTGGVENIEHARKF